MRKLDSILVIGIGNNTRRDDGLGWAFIESLERDYQSFHEDQLICKYQLMVEDAEDVANFETVYFVDACKTPIENGAVIEEIQPSEELTFSTHAVPPNQILNLCKTVYDKTPKAFVVKVFGEAWNIEMGLTTVAKNNLDKALELFISHLRTTGIDLDSHQADHNAS